MLCMVVFSHSPSTLVSDIFHAQTDCSIQAIHTPGRLNITADDILGAGPNWFTCSRSNISFTHSGASRASGPPASGILSKGLPRPGGSSGAPSGRGLSQSTETIQDWVEEVFDLLSGLNSTSTLNAQENVTLFVTFWVLSGGLSVINLTWQHCNVCS